MGVSINTQKKKKKPMILVTFIKENEVCNSMGDQLLNDCLVTFIEKFLFLNVSDDAIVNRFQNMKLNENSCNNF